MAHDSVPNPANIARGLVPPRPNPPLKTQPNVRHTDVPAGPGNGPRTGGNTAPSGPPLGGSPAMPVPLPPPGIGAPQPAQGGVPFTIICPEGYLPVVKFIKIPERTPRQESETAAGASSEGGEASAASDEAANG